MNKILAIIGGLLIFGVISVFYLFDPTVSIQSLYIPSFIGSNQRINVFDLKNFDKTRLEHLKQAPVRLRTFESMDNTTHPTAYYNALALEVICPTRVRVGHIGDGGKWVCNPWSLPANCTVYSLGINGQIDFESDIQKMTENRCRVYGYDLAIQSDFIKRKYAKIRGELKAGRIVETADLKVQSADPLISINQEANNRKNQTIDIFKIDIEGSELRVLPEFVKSHQPCQILVETHSDPHPTYQLLRALSQADYWLFSFEINAWGLQYCEYSFIHRSCFDLYGILELAKIFSPPKVETPASNLTKAN